MGKVIVATWTPHEIAAVELINEMGLEMQVIFNKGAVMILPSGVNKASGLRAALKELGLSPRNTVGVGDAENDHAFLSICECGVAVQNALQALKDRADLVTDGDHGTGIEQLIDQMVKEDLASLDPRLTRHRLTLGHRLDGQALTLSAVPAPDPVRRQLRRRQVHPGHGADRGRRRKGLPVLHHRSRGRFPGTAQHGDAGRCPARPAPPRRCWRC